MYRTTFTVDQQRAIIASAEDLRDRIALRLLLNYALRKGALRSVQIKHFDHGRQRLTIFTKGQKVRELPIPDAELLGPISKLLLETEARARALSASASSDDPGRQADVRDTAAGTGTVPDKPMSDHGLAQLVVRQPRAG